MRILLVDDEAQILRGLARMIENEAEDWEVETAISGAEALALLDEETFDVVVTDMRMPEMDGAQLLEIIEEQYPNVLRVVLSGQADRDTVLRAIKPMHQYLSKPCDPQVLIDAIRRARVFQETITSTEVLNAIGRANCLPSLPGVVSEINCELQSDRCSAASLAKIISQDPMLCAKILQLANSAIFGLRHPVVDVERGLSVLGADMIRSLAVSLAVFSSDRQSTAQAAEELFRHSLTVADLCRRIAKWTNADAAITNTVFSGGLLHDVGKMILVNAFEDRYRALQRKADTDSTPFWSLELKEFGATHAGIGAYLLELWGLPETIIQTVASHHSFEVCSLADLPCRIVFAADWLTHDQDVQHLITGVSAEAFTSEQKEFAAQLQVWREKYQQSLQENQEPCHV